MVEVSVADINILALVAGALVAYVIGALWYSPLLFAKAWMREVGKTEEELKEGGKSAYALAAVAWFVLSYIVNYLLAFGGGDGLVDGLRVGVSVGVAAIAVTALHGAFSGRSWTLWAIDAGYALVGAAIIGAVAGVL